jgi:hypothetical protein
LQCTIQMAQSPPPVRALPAHLELQPLVERHRDAAARCFEEAFTARETLGSVLGFEDDGEYTATADGTVDRAIFLGLSWVLVDTRAAADGGGGDVAPPSPATPTNFGGKSTRSTAPPYALADGSGFIAGFVMCEDAHTPIVDDGLAARMPPRLDPVFALLDSVDARYDAHLTTTTPFTNGKKEASSVAGRLLCVSLVGVSPGYAGAGVCTAMMAAATRALDAAAPAQ